ncbi:hypothetical protein D7M11_27705 [Paenibacillus ginsengarvi]|uniref:Uncharacterized protein n=2 Tax=Paenibacillus ginsengarvi TaxID=400777 RepID=A0A3B0BK97_9BACL|nr:hypothetical protein D7M11_27705 [Paenibacillus ginsengarvi]
MLRMTKVMDPTLLEADIVDYNEKVEALLKNSEAARSQRDLKGAVDFLVRAQQLVDDMNEAIAEADKQQRDEYVFPLSVAEKLRKNREEFETPKVREPSPLSEAKRTFAKGSYELLYMNQTGGEFRFFHFSVPADINEPIWIGSPLAQQPMVVIAAQVFQE